MLEVLSLTTDSVLFPLSNLRLELTTPVEPTSLIIVSVSPPDITKFNSSRLTNNSSPLLRVIANTLEPTGNLNPLSTSA
nr:MAG TPA: hypothetical protein [Bacteriophage sp.]